MCCRCDIIIILSVTVARPKIGAVSQERLVIEDADQRKRIISSIHDTAHMGLNRTTDMVAAKYTGLVLP